VEDVLRAEHAQAAHADRTGGGAIAIEIADHQDALVIGDGLDQQTHRIIDAGQQLRRVEAAQFRQRQLWRTGAAAGIERASSGSVPSGQLPGTTASRRRIIGVSEDGCTASAARDIGIAGLRKTSP
jgi:hypothetical protein